MTINENGWSQIRYISKYALLMTLLIFTLKWLEWKFLIMDHALEIYIGLIALFFTFLGIWIATKIVKPRVQKIIVEKKIYLDPDDSSFIDENELEKMNLSPREYEVLQHLVRGHSNAQIANELCLSLSTIKTHVSNLFQKLDVKSRTQAIEKAQRLRIVPRTTHA
ncbi:MAG TPA: response regulator transcription factor [Saprospiraceae bacterium]|nr:response regulator transcription factor [Saprospiraceae bacterium]HPG07471.1 response regulator transcription factor [Saprospiraceae bacterium]HPR00990.1 response regulator transcription factor [Saprospiraceae bacterium]HQU53378.1 response regulator transcription factor [Saprospiraceae bacterium]HRV84979.1 response regulator transcription factor [Saprospiraceae bacterium]